MKRSYSPRHYLTFEKEHLDPDHVSLWTRSDFVEKAITAMGMAKPRQCWDLARWHPYPDHMFKTGADNYVKDRKRICSVVLGELPKEELPAAINRREYRTPHGLTAIGADLPIHVTDYWSPTESSDPIFSTRKTANNLMKIAEEEAKDSEPSANVVIVDQGLNQEYITHLKGHFIGGWYLANSPKKPGDYRVGHGSMLARNILNVAPDAAIYDLPIIPQDIDDNQKFLSTVHAAFDQVLETIHYLQQEDGEPRWQRPWVFVNAWATYNTAGESMSGNYTNGLDHQFNRLITEMAEEFDMVFAAGNCGQFCPSRRCGVDDIGPGQSILGANSHPKVLTVGAVRTDGMWLGYSSQGPGKLSEPGKLPERKPDVCAASQFCEDDNAAAVNTGTSAACAIAAGVVARLRSKFDTKNLPPATLKNILIETTTARPPGGWDSQLGHGIIDAEAAEASARKASGSGGRGWKAGLRPS